MVRLLFLLLLCNIFIIAKSGVFAQQQQLEPSILYLDKIAERLENETCKGKIQTYKTCSFNDKLEQYEKKKGKHFIYYQVLQKVLIFQQDAK